MTSKRTSDEMCEFPATATVYAFPENQEAPQVPTANGVYNSTELGHHFGMHSATMRTTFDAYTDAQGNNFGDGPGIGLWGSVQFSGSFEVDYNRSRPTEVCHHTSSYSGFQDNGHSPQYSIQQPGAALPDGLVNTKTGGISSGAIANTNTARIPSWAIPNTNEPQRSHPGEPFDTMADRISREEFVKYQQLQEKKACTLHQQNQRFRRGGIQKTLDPSYNMERPSPAIACSGESEATQGPTSITKENSYTRRVTRYRRIVSDLRADSDTVHRQGSGSSMCSISSPTSEYLTQPRRRRSSIQRAGVDGHKEHHSASLGQKRPRPPSCSVSAKVNAKKAKASGLATFETCVAPAKRKGSTKKGNHKKSQNARNPCEGIPKEFDIVGMSCSAIERGVKLGGDVAALVEHIEHHRRRLVGAQTFFDIAYGCLEARSDASQGEVIPMLFDVRLTVKILILCGSLQDHELLDLFRKIPLKGCEPEFLVTCYHNGVRWLNVISGGTLHFAVMLLVLKLKNAVETMQLDHLTSQCHALLKNGRSWFKVQIGSVLIPTIIQFSLCLPLPLDVAFVDSARRLTSIHDRDIMSSNLIELDRLFATKPLSLIISTSLVPRGAYWKTLLDQHFPVQPPHPTVHHFAPSESYHETNPGTPCIPNSATLQDITVAHKVTSLVSITSFPRKISFEAAEACRAEARGGYLCPSQSAFVAMVNDIQAPWSIGQDYLRMSAAYFEKPVVRLKSSGGFSLLTVVRNMPAALRSTLETAAEWIIWHQNDRLDTQDALVDTQDVAIRKWASKSTSDESDSSEILVQRNLWEVQAASNTTINPGWTVLKALMAPILDWHRKVSEVLSPQIPGVNGQRIQTIRFIHDAVNKLISGKTVFIVAENPMWLIFPSLRISIELGSGIMVIMHLPGLYFMIQHFYGRGVIVVLD